jgi:large subunit ribosomal protein L22
MNAVDLDEIEGAKASHRFARLSASKARAVLDLIRDRDVDDARDILRLTERGAAAVVVKVLDSAVANAAANHHLDPDALYVAECWADEGPTLKRYRPRARGRATRINKRSCHITVVVAQMDEEELAARAQARERSAGRSDRAARVAASRRAAARPTEDEVAEDEPMVVEDEVVADEVVEDEVVVDEPVVDEEAVADEVVDEEPVVDDEVAAEEVEVDDEVAADEIEADEEEEGGSGEQGRAARAERGDAASAGGASPEGERGAQRPPESGEQ